MSTLECMWRAMRPLLIRAGSDVERRAEHALYAQGHADLHVQLILMEAGMMQLASKSRSYKLSP